MQSKIEKDLEIKVENKKEQSKAINVNFNELFNGHYYDIKI